MDSRIIEYLIGTDQYDLFKDASEEDVRRMIEQAEYMIDDMFKGDVKEAIQYVNTGREDCMNKLFPEGP